GGRRDKWRHRLRDDRELLAVAEERGIDLLLHGHIHEPFTVEHGRVRGVGVGSSTYGRGKHRGRIHVYSIEEKRLSVETLVFDPARGVFERKIEGIVQIR
ncbi:MAG TPA: hypothetical protein VFF73_03980, partial [Planctomycetota bacterium]|nr:hypothetical protein [Planctomycetota bacterium]